MKCISKTERQIDTLCDIIQRKPLGTLNELKNSNEWPHLLELFELTNQISGYKLLKVARNVIIPIPIFIENYNGHIRVSNQKPHMLILEDNFLHRRMMDFQTYVKIEGILFDLKQHKKIEVAIDEAFILANKIIEKEDDWTIISGPISNGGFLNENGNPDVFKNLRRFNKAIVGASKRGHNVFNSMPFEKLFGEMNRLGYKSDFFIDEFFEPILETRKFKNMLQMPDWETSRGACNEDRIASRLKIKKSIIDFDISLPAHLSFPVPKIKKEREFSNSSFY